MDELKNFLTKNHPEVPDASPELSAKTWARINEKKPVRQRLYVALSMTTAACAMIIGVAINISSVPMIQTAPVATFDEESFVLESFADFEEDIQDSSDEYAFGF